MASKSLSEKLDDFAKENPEIASDLESFAALARALERAVSKDCTCKSFSGGLTVPCPVHGK